MKSTTNSNHSHKLVLNVITVLALFVLLSSSALAVRTFRVTETDVLDLTFLAQDEDHDELTYIYPSPFTKQGRWQTGYEDAGEYDLELRVTDGVNEVVEPIKIIVEEKNRNPFLLGRTIAVAEGETVDLKTLISDPDSQDVLALHFQEPFDTSGQWITTLDDAGRYVTTVLIDDGSVQIEQRIEVLVGQTNQAPEFISVFTDEPRVRITEDEYLFFNAQARDPEGDYVTYRWLLDGQEILTTRRGFQYFGFESNREHTLTVIATDAELETRQEWTIQVENINRAPLQSDLAVTANEGETITLDLPSQDRDGDEVIYSFDQLFSNQGTYAASFDDAGSYQIAASVFDGEFTRDFTVFVDIINVNRPAQLSMVSSATVWEGIENRISFTGFDPDGDLVQYSAFGDVEILQVDETSKELVIIPSYNRIERKVNRFTNILNVLGVEQYLFPQTATTTVVLQACSAGTCSELPLDLTIKNTNRAPVFEQEELPSIQETQKIAVQGLAVDPDGDIVRYRFSRPLSSYFGTWKTGYEDQGEYPITITATDGKKRTELETTLLVEKRNRLPSIWPSDKKVVVNEGQEFGIYLNTNDPDPEDKEALQISVDQAPQGSSLSQSLFQWAPSYDTVTGKKDTWFANLLSRNLKINRKFSSEKETVQLSFSATDGIDSVSTPVQVVVKNVNQAPVIESISPQAEQISATVGDTLLFEVNAVDPDSQELQIRWNFGGVDFSSVDNAQRISREFTSAGQKRVVATVSDGRDSLRIEWIIDVAPAPVQVALKQQPTVEQVSVDPYSFNRYVIEYTTSS